MQGSNPGKQEKTTLGIGKHIRYYRLQRGLSQEQLGQMIGVEAGVISNYENDKYKPSAESIMQLAKALYTSTDSLLLENPSEKFKDIIPDEEWLNLFLKVMSLSKEEKKAVKTVLTLITSAK